jgi:LysR family transcriptional regulator of gallate degradation
LRSGTFGSVVIGAGPAWLRRHLPLAVAQVIAKHPDIHIQIDGSFDETLAARVAAG